MNNIPHDLIDHSRFIERVSQALFRSGSTDSLSTRLAKMDMIFLILRALGGKLPPKFYLSALDPGMGKTETIITFIKCWSDAGFTPRGGMLICVSRMEEIKTYIKRSRLSESDYAVLTSAEEINNMGRGSHDTNGARVLFTTQQMVMNRTRGKILAEAKCFHYKHESRAVRVWDESYIPAQPITIALDDLSALASPLRSSIAKYIDAVEKITEEVNGSGIGSVITIPTEFSILHRKELRFNGSLRNELSARQQDVVDEMHIAAGRPVRIASENGRGKMLVGSSEPMASDFAPLLILDASGRVRGTYRVWENHSKSLVRLKSAAWRFSKLTVHLWRRASGRTTLANPDHRKVILSNVAKLINANPHDDWLVVHHKKGRFDIRGELESMLGEPDQVSFVHWGDHHGTNKYREIEKVIMIGSHNYPQSAYEAHYLAASNVDPLNVDKNDVRALANREWQHNVLQAICRSNVRNGYYEVCGKADVYMIATGTRTLKETIEATFPGCEIKDWAPDFIPLSGMAKKVADELRRLFADSSVQRVKKSDVRATLKIAHSQGLSQVLKRADFKEFLANERIGVEPRHFVKVGSPTPDSSSDHED